MQKQKLYWVTFIITALIGLISCSNNTLDKSDVFNPNQPIEITKFYPDSGGIATPIIIEGRNFGVDTAGMKVYFEDKDGIRHPAGLVSSNGTRIYAIVPQGLAFKREMNILVERKTSEGQEFIVKSPNQFLYKTQTSVTTVAGLVSPDKPTNTVGGDLATCSFSSPFNICLDDEGNIIVVERNGGSGKPKQPDTVCHNENGDKVSGNICMVSIADNSSIILKSGVSACNAPSYSNATGVVYVPEDDGMKYYEMPKSLNYIPHQKTVLKTEETSTIDQNNWKHCFVVNQLDRMIYTVMWKGQLVRINPQNRTAEILLRKISNVTTGDGGASGSDSYIAFSPVKGEENMLYVSLTDYHQIWRVDVSKITSENKDTYNGEPYAGIAIYEGVMNGKGWEDGQLKRAKFRHPRQLCFTYDGKLYIADSGNSCIRMIDTAIEKEKAIVTTPIGLPEKEGYKDGGPEIAQFHFPCGLAVSPDGSTIYVADTQNKVIRKLSIE